MEYLMGVIYGVIMVEWIFGNSSKKIIVETRGRDYYRIHGMLNMILGMIGIFIINIFLKGKGIVPEWTVCAGLVGFMLMTFIGLYYVYKMMTSPY